MENPQAISDSEKEWLCSQILKIIPREIFDPRSFLQNSPELGPLVLKNVLGRSLPASTFRQENRPQDHADQSHKDSPQLNLEPDETPGEKPASPSEANRGASDRANPVMVGSSPGPLPPKTNQQPESGFLCISNEIVEAFCRTNLSPYQWRILLALMQRTCRQNQKSQWISLSQLTEDTKIDRRNVHRALRALEERELIVVCRDDKKRIRYGFQKRYKRWKMSSVETPIKDKAASRKTGWKKGNL